MLDTLKELCSLSAASGDEKSVRDYIISKIDGKADWYTDNLGNIIAFKKGKNKSCKRLMADAHMDEVGLIISSVTDDGFLKFHTVGGIDTAVLMFRRVKIGNVNGVISGKPVHLLSGSEKKKLPQENSLYIDIGAADRAEALGLVSLGDRAVICGDYAETYGKSQNDLNQNRNIVACFHYAKIICNNALFARQITLISLYSLRVCNA